MVLLLLGAALLPDENTALAGIELPSAITQALIKLLLLPRVPAADVLNTTVPLVIEGFDPSIDELLNVLLVASLINCTVEAKLDTLIFWIVSGSSTPINGEAVKLTLSAPLRLIIGPATLPVSTELVPIAG